MDLLALIMIALPFVVWGLCFFASIRVGPPLRKTSDPDACDACGYDLTGLPNPRQCPECGAIERPEFRAVRTNKTWRYALSISGASAALVFLFVLLGSTEPIQDWFQGVAMVLALCGLVSLSANAGVLYRQPLKRALWIRLPATVVSSSLMAWLMLGYADDMGHPGSYAVLALYIAPPATGVISGCSMLLSLIGFGIARCIRHLMNTWE